MARPRRLNMETVVLNPTFNSTRANPVSARRDSGVVLLSVLLIVALLAAVAYQLLARHSLTVAQARYSFGSDQSLAYALGAESLARQVLFEDWSQSGQGVDNLLETWAQPLAPFEIENGLLEVQVRDMHRCFNLNSLAGNEAKGNLERLKTLLRNSNVPETLANTWQDWVDADDSITGFGAEDGDYLLLDRAYRTANQRAGHVSEFNLIVGFETDYLETLGDVLCVIPSDSLRLNINTVSAEVLASLSPNLTAPQMQGLVEVERRYTAVSEVVTEFPDLAGAVDALTVTSEYFEVQVRAVVDGSVTELTSLLHRDPNNGSLTVIVRDLGRDFRSLFQATPTST
ncbi:MAG: type II secretion system minor pseudopilin GspK [Gammaproteobacteria bacterium]|nr:type II secretion system minor pseudopilin GspK [Gammaproteobacteria bacterium]